MKRLVGWLVVGAVVGTFSLQVHAQSRCNSGASVLAALWQRYGEQLKAQNCKDSAECMANASKKEAIVKDLIAFWNQQAQGSWATIGPRPILFGGTLNDGKLVAGTKRLFVAQAPLDADGVDIVITKEGGGAAEVTLSRFDGTACQPGDKATFDKDDKKGTTKTLKIRGARESIVYVNVDALKTNAFDYKFTAVTK